MKRRGVTLTEVLVAIFVTGLGLMALMTLFPLGAVNMSLAIKDDRAQHAGANATAFLRAAWRQGLDNGQPDPNIAAALANGPAYLDPIGQLTYAGGNNAIVGTNFPRISLATVANLPTAMSHFSLQDDIDFNLDGQGINNGQLKRDVLYTWAYMLRPPQPGSPRVIDFSVVVYNRRSASLSGGAPAGETPVAANFSPADNSIALGGQPPNLRKGSWVLDGTSGFFYRVNSVLPGMVKVDQPLRNMAPAGTIVIMNNVVEVFDKSTLE